MKDITKRLEWIQIPGMEPYTGYVAGCFLTGRFVIMPHVDGFSAVFKNNPESRVAYPVVDHVATLEEAMAACREHYDNLVLSFLSPEAVQLLLKHDS